MEYTQNLNLPQFAETDRIMHDDFNDAFSKLDTAVKANSTAIASKADAADLTAEAQAREAGDLWVKLGTYSLTADAQTLNIPIANAADYAELRLYCSVTISGNLFTRYTINFNNTTNTFGSIDYEHTQQTESTTTSITLLPDAMTGSGGNIRLFPMGENALGIVPSDIIGWSRNGPQTNASNRRYCTSDLSFSTLQSLQITGNRTGSTGEFILYGLKK